MVQLQKRLANTQVEVTHAVRQGSTLMERHIIRAWDIERDEPWTMEVMAAYEITPEDKIIRHYELTQMLEGSYEGGW